jgi:hypothetical protein
MPIPCDVDAEEAVLGSMLLSGEATAKALQLVQAGDFYRPAHGHIFAAIEALYRKGEPVDSVTVSDELQRAGLSELIGDPGIFIHLLSTTPGPTYVDHYGRIVVRHSVARHLDSVIHRVSGRIGEWADPYELADEIQTELGAIDMPVVAGKQRARTLDEIIDDAETSSPWALPGLVRVDWRVVIIAAEGSGKSVTLRQVAACAAQGIHPYRYSRFDPIRVLMVDLENPAGAIAETGATIVAKLRKEVGDSYDPGNLRILEKPGGMDLQTRHDRTELEREITLHRPQLVMVGPGYKLLKRHLRGGERESYEEVTDAAFEVLDDLRTRHGFGLVIEHHAPKGKSGQARELVPYGSQRWLAWPELGLTLEPDQKLGWKYKIGRFRGDRLQNDWPSELHRSDLMRPGVSNGWPWEGRWEKGMNIALGMSVEPPPDSLFEEQPF